MQPLSAPVSNRLRQAYYMLVVGLFWISLYLYAPTLSVYAHTKTSDLALVGVILSMYGLWQTLVRLPLGIFADWLGWHKPLIVIGMLLAGLGAWLMGTSSGVNGLLYGRSITGLAAGTWVPMVILFSAFFPPQQAIKATALLTLVGSISRLLATGMTGALNDLGGYRLAFSLSAGVAVLGAVLLLPLPEARRKGVIPSFSSIARLAMRRDVLLPALLNCVTQYVAMAMTFGFIPILAEQLGASNLAQSGLVAANLAALTVGNLGIARAERRFSHQAILIAGFAVMGAGTGVAALASSLGTVYVAQVLTGLSIGITYPVLMGLSIQQVDPAERSTAMGVHQSVYGAGMFAGPWLSGILARSFGLQTMFAVTALACLVLGWLGTSKLEDR